MTLRSITCSNCQGAGLELEANGLIVCRFCGTTNALAGVICPKCEHVNPEGTDTCGDCRSSLLRSCPACGNQNWSGADACRQCGQSLDAMSRLSTRWGLDPANRLNEQQAASATIKALEAADSRRRMAELDSIEDRRQAALAAGWKKQAERQRQLGWLVSAGVALFGLLAALALLLVYLR